MASKIISKNDIAKNAIVLNDELSRALHQRGVFPAMGGGNPLVLYAVKMFFINTQEEILVSYYASMRLGSDRAIEERIWCAQLGEEAAIGDELCIEFKDKRFVVEIRPAP